MMDEQIDQAVFDAILKQLVTLNQGVATLAQIAATNQQALTTLIDGIDNSLVAMGTLLASIDQTGKTVLSLLTDQVVSISVVPQPPTPRRNAMTTPTVRLMKKSQATKKTAAFSPAAPPVPGSFILFDNQDDSCNVYGVTATGQQVDISSVASLTVTTSDPTVVSVDAPQGMKFAMHAVLVPPQPLPAQGTVLGNVTITATATWTDGSQGPFTFSLPVTLEAAAPGAAVSIIIVPGTPTVHAA